MAGNVKQFDSIMPTITGRETTAELAQIVLSFTYELVQQLQYQLSNLDASNFNNQSLEDIQLDTTREIREAVKKLTTAVENLQSDLTGTNTEVKALNETIKKISQNLETVTGTANANKQDLQKILGFLQPADGGGGSIGKNGQRLDLVGDIYTNGKPLGGAK